MTASPGSSPREVRPRRVLVEDNPQAAASVVTDPDAAAQPRPRRVRRRLWLRLIALMVALGLAATAYFVVRGVRALDRIERDASMLVDYPGRPAAAQGTNYLVLASHTSSADARADVIMLVHLNRTRDRVYLMSLPRDFYLADQNGTPGGLQDIYGRDGPGGLQRVLEVTFNTRIDHVARVDYEGFISLTADLGGVVVNNPVETTTPAGMHFAKGPILVSGDQALAYVADDSSIAGRDQVLAERQQSVLRAIVLKLVQPESFLNPFVVSSVLTSLAEHLAVDDELKTPALVELATSIRLSRSTDIIAVRPPVLGTTTGANGSPATLPSPDLISELSAALREDEVDAYLAAHPG